MRTRKKDEKYWNIHLNQDLAKCWITKIYAKTKGTKHEIRNEPDKRKRN